MKKIILAGLCFTSLSLFCMENDTIPMFLEEERYDDIEREDVESMTIITNVLKPWAKEVLKVRALRSQNLDQVTNRIADLQSEEGFEIADLESYLETLDDAINLWLDIMQYLKKPHNIKIIRELNAQRQRIKGEYKALVGILEAESVQLSQDIRGYNNADQQERERITGRLTTLTSLYNSLNAMAIKKNEVQDSLDTSQRNIQAIRIAVL